MQQLNVAILNPFLTATIECLQEFCGLDAQRENLTIKANPSIVSGVSAILDIHGKVVGAVVLTMQVPVAGGLVSRFRGHEIRDAKELHQGLSELCNVISGRARRNIDSALCQISLPKVVFGDHYLGKIPDKIPMVQVHFGTEVGSIVLEAFFQDMRSRAYVSEAPGVQTRPADMAAPAPMEEGEETKESG